MSVYLDKKRKTYYYDFKHNGKHYKKRGFRLKSEAVDAERLALIKAKEIKDDKITIEELAYSFLEHYKVDSDPDTYYSYEHRIKTFIINYFKDKRVDKLTPSDMTKWQTFINESTFTKKKDGKEISVHYSCRTKNIIRRYLSTLFIYGMKYHNLPKNFAIYVKPFKEKEIKEESSKEVWSREQFDSFLEFVEDDIYAAFFTLLFWTGLRRGEAKALTWNDIDFEKSLISIRRSLSGKTKGKTLEPKAPKTQGSIRTIPIDYQTMSLIAKLKDYYKEFSDFNNQWYIFGGNEPLKNTNLDRIKNNAIKKAKLPYLTNHGFRHSHASFLLWNGFNIVYVSKRLGHSNTQMTLNTYAHIINALEDENMAKLNQLRGGILGEKS